MNNPGSKRAPEEPEVSKAEIQHFIRQVGDDLYFGVDNIRVRLGRIERQLKNTATKEDIANLKIWVLVGAGTAGLSLLGAAGAVVVGLMNYLR
ncbi:MAG: hypothetical protein OXH56_08995 [Gemmatimonadetes bacterium]|nr:hypothetical protein [Gemmatimonadota bacterium]